MGLVRAGNLTVLDLFLDGLALTLLGPQRVPSDPRRDAAGALAVAKLARADPVHGPEPARKVRRIGPAHRRAN